MTPPLDTRIDTFFGEHLRIRQPVRGYRFSLDAVLLSGFALEARVPRRPVRVADVGTGCGIIAQTLAWARPDWQVASVEIDPALASLARWNAAHNPGRVEVTEGDARTWTPGRCDLVVANPPYFAPDEGPVANDPTRAGARSLIHGDLTELAQAWGRLTRDARSPVCLVYPAPRWNALSRALDTAGLFAHRLRWVHHTLEAPAHRVLVEATRRACRQLSVDPPLILRTPEGAETEQFRRWLEGRF